MLSLEKNKNYKNKIVALFLFFVLLGTCLIGEPARAQWVTTNPITDAGTLWNKVTTIAKDLKVNIGQAAGRALMKSFRNFVNKMARDTAIWLASGNYNKGPMWYTDASGYFEKAGLQAAADAIGYFGDEMQFLQKYGINLCNPGVPAYNLGIKLKMYNTLDPQPRCNWKDIQNAYTNLGTAGAWSQVGLSFEPGQNGLSLSMETLDALDKIGQDEKQRAKDTAEFTGVQTPVTEAVAQQAKNPTALTAVNPQQNPQDIVAEQKAKDAEITQNNLTMGNIAGVLGDAASMFTNTLSDQLAQKLRSQGLLSIGKLASLIACSYNIGGACSDSAANNEQAQVVGSREVAEANFAEFVKPSFAEIEDYQYVATELTPACDTNNGPYCGALDPDLKELLSLAQGGTPLTVGQAVDQGKLHKEWDLKPAGDCKSNAYCYDNLIKLRFFRILPLGWEIAAQKVTSVGPTKLGEVLDNFSSSTSPFYHLIDPNWLITAPKARCAAQANSSVALYGPTADTPGQRAQYCADVQNCVGEDSQTGQCNFWGYCLREKNFWRLGADSCDAQFNTCTTYASSHGQAVSFLANTIDRGICTADNAGCRAYATISAYSGGAWNWQTNIPNSRIYFNHSAEACNSDSEGCSKFIRTAPGVENDVLNLKKAPQFYNCYGENLVPADIGSITQNTLSSSTLAWAANKADLYKISNALSAEQKTQCSRFAKVCSAEERGCELYKPQDGNPAVPGVLANADLCPNECVGYETYLEQPLTQFSGDATAYFIPSTAKSCTLQNVGCEEFVNIESQEAGGEQKAYFSQIKSCSKIATEGDTFYTWEGSDTSGYQLKTYILKKDVRAGHVGEPAYNTTDASILSSYESTCNSTIYANRVALGKDFNSDCREFYNRQGAKSYRLYSKTVTVSPTECKNFRKSLSDQTSCGQTGGTWDPSKGICSYSFISSEAKACSAAVVGCRAYKGNAGNNFQTTYFQDFETGTVGTSALVIGWPGTFSSESTAVGGKSLKATNNSSFSTTLEKGKTISIAFWAKSQNSSLTLAIQFGSSVSGQNFVSSGDQQFNLTSNWAVYTAGPFTVSWEPNNSSSTIKFDGGSGVFYLDNIATKQMIDNVYVIKDSWVTPSSCDNVNGDQFGSSLGGNSSNPLRLTPQAQLGCESYNNRKGDPVAVKSFSGICREEAVGCEGLIDTTNNDISSSTLVNALCNLDRTSQSNQAIDCKDKNGEHKCDVLPNQQSCRFNYVGLGKTITSLNSELNNLDAGATTKDTEGHSYNVTLTSDAESVLVSADHLVYLVNDPAFQCSNDNVGCRALGKIDYSATGSWQASTTVYLKDQPDNYSKILCSHEAEGCDQYSTSQGGTDYFKDPTVFGNRFCEWKDKIDDSHPYGGWVIKGTTTTCYPSTNYKIYKNGDASYNGTVGLCPAAQNGCSEFVDPVGAGVSSGNLPGESYYVINNDKIDRGSCGGTASLQQGCVLFNETAKGDRLWNASATYELSQQSNYQKVNPVDCGVNGEKCTGANDNNDANVVLKVQRDRVCGEWLACASAMKVLKDGKLQDICTELKNCDQVASTAQVGGNDELLGQCGHWVDSPTPAKGSFLSSAVYATIPDVGSFSVKDFSGYSIYNGRQIADMLTSVSTSGLQAKDNGGGVGSVYNGGGTIAESCRGFASTDVPPETTASRLNSSLYPDYCSFAKVEYSGSDKASIVKYYPANQLLENQGVCDGGFLENGQSKKGLPCLDAMDCSDDRGINQRPSNTINLGASCLTDRKISREFGWNGYCLLKDSSDKCIMWYPLAIPGGGVDLYALNREAGYYPPEGSGKFWCVQAKGNSNIAPNSNGNIGSYGKGYVYYLASNVTSIFPRTKDDYNAGFNVGELSFSVGGSPRYLSEIVAVGLEPTEISNYVPSKEILLFRDQKLSSVSNINVANWVGNYWSGPVQKKGDKWYLDMVWRDAPAGQQPQEVFYDTLSKHFCDNEHKGNLDFFGARIVFDEKGKLTAIRSKTCDSGSNASSITVNIKLYLTEVCTDIRQVVQDNPNNLDAQASPFGFKAKARTDRVWQNSSYLVGGDSIGPLQMPYNQFNTPFGSFGRILQPTTTNLKDYLVQNKITSSFEEKKALESSGLWPIWFKTNGATPLNCNPDNGGDCGKTAICVSGPHANEICNTDQNYNVGTSEEGNNYCDEVVGPGVCELASKTCAGTGIACNSEVDCFITSKCSGRCGLFPGNANYDIRCQEDSDCPGGVDAFCYNTNLKTCETGGAFCDNDSDCQSQVSCVELNKCKGGIHNGVACDPSNNNCADQGTIPHACSNQFILRGMCVGGLNHGLSCATTKDCPEKKYTSTQGGEATEQGVCVGSSLEDGKMIPQTAGENAGNYDTANNGQHPAPNASFVRLMEIFASYYGTWAWNSAEGRYYQPSGGWQNGDESRNSHQQNLNFGNDEAGYTIRPPKVYSLKQISGTDNKFTWGEQNKFSLNLVDNGGNGVLPTFSGTSAVITAAFYAYADNDQMPITRVAINWGDGSIYETRGWYKNHKPICESGNLVCSGDLNRPCFENSDCAQGESCSAPTNADNRLHFGNSSGACEENYFTFKHVYECKVGGLGWDSNSKSCKFTPKVQILDNWGWCNGTCNTNGVQGGCWNDDPQYLNDPSKKAQESRSCFTGKSEPWTSFNGVVQIKP